MAADEELLGRGTRQVDSREGGEFRTHAGSQRAGVEQASYRRGLQSLQSNVDHRPGCQNPTARCRKRSERESHCGAAPVIACSESRTRNIDWARWRCWASQATTSFGEGAATSTSSPRTATHMPMKGRSTSPVNSDCPRESEPGCRAGATVAECARWRSPGLAARAAVKPSRVSARGG